MGLLLDVHLVINHYWKSEVVENGQPGQPRTANGPFQKMTGQCFDKGLHKNLPEDLD